MCYDDETCTTTCPSSRRRREAQRALGIFRRETIDGVDFQDNGLPGELISLFEKYHLVGRINFNFIFSVTDVLTAQILVPDSLPEETDEIVDVGRAGNVVEKLEDNISKIQAALKKSKNQIKTLNRMFN